MKNLIIILFIFTISNLSAQDKHDYIWMMGYPIAIPEDTIGGTKIDFNFDPPEVSFFETPLFLLSPNNFSDKEGNLKFYTNGCSIVDSNHSTMENGDTLNPGDFYDDFCEIYYPVWQSMLSLPKPENDSIAVLFHLRIDDNNNNLNGELLQTTVNLNGNNSNGAVIEKNELVLEGDFNQQLTAVRHGNGRDWWLILPEKNSNKFSFLLFDPTGIQFSHEQSIGEAWNNMDWAGQAVFSPNGEKFIRTNPFNDIHIYDFDRCTGTLSNPKFIEIPEDSINVACAGATVSANSRFLYISAFTNIYQYDLSVPNIANTRVTVAEYDGFTSPFSTTFFQGMLAPNGKIYIVANSGVNVMHIIHQPNEKGLACEVEQHGLQTPAYLTYQVPNFPHFRLYDMPDSPCDTLGINTPVATEEVEKEQSQIKLYPNPATDKLTIESPISLDKNSQLRVINAIGQVVKVSDLPIGQQRYEIDLSNQESGIYFLQIATAGKVRFTDKFQLIR